MTLSEEAKTLRVHGALRSSRTCGEVSDPIVGQGPPQVKQRAGRTAGTGTILDTYPLGDGSELSIGTREWLTRDGRSIWHVGIRPDVPVLMPRGAVPLRPADLVGLDRTSLLASSDTQLLRAISLLDGDVAAR